MAAVCHSVSLRKLFPEGFGVGACLIKLGLQPGDMLFHGLTHPVGVGIRLNAEHCTDSQLVSHTLILQSELLHLRFSLNKLSLKVADPFAQGAFLTLYAEIQLLDFGGFLLILKRFSLQRLHLQLHVAALILPAVVAAAAGVNLYLLQVALHRRIERAVDILCLRLAVDGFGHKRRERLIEDFHHPVEQTGRHSRRRRLHPGIVRAVGGFSFGSLTLGLRGGFLFRSLVIALIQRDNGSINPLEFFLLEFVIAKTERSFK